jgi:hypothetical protein
MSLFIIFVNPEPTPDINLWQTSLSSMLLTHNICLASMVSMEPSVVRLYSIGHLSNTTLELKGLTSLEQLVTRACDFTGTFTFYGGAFFLHTNTPKSMNGCDSFASSGYPLHHYDCIADIVSAFPSKKKKAIPLIETKAVATVSAEAPALPDALGASVSIAPFSLIQPQRRPSVRPYEPIKHYPKILEPALQQKQQLEAEVKGCWLSKSNKARADIELSFWQTVFSYQDVNPFSSPDTGINHVKKQFEEAGTYVQVIKSGWCRQTKSASIIKNILKEVDDPENVSLLERRPMNT